MASNVRTRQALSPAKLYLLLALLVLAAAPLAGYLWETLHQLLALDIAPQRLVLSIPVLALLAGLLYLMRRVVSA